MSSRPDREQRRNAILHAARESFCDKGYEQTSVAEIACKVGVVEGTVYRYFESKHELLIEVLTDWYQQMFDDYANALEGMSDARSRVQALIWRHLRTIHEAPQLCRLMFREARDDIGEVNSTLRKLNRRYTRFLVEVIDHGSKAGEFRQNIRLPLLRDLIYGGIEHYCWRYLTGQGELDIDQAAQDITSIFCDGIIHTAEHMTPATNRLEQLIDRMESLIPPPQTTS
ncbi:MAG: TetR/AcrR family transcriptional regulator [Oceanococcus sp.]